MGVRCRRGAFSQRKTKNLLLKPTEQNKAAERQWPPCRDLTQSHLAHSLRVNQYAPALLF